MSGSGLIKMLLELPAWSQVRSVTQLTSALGVELSGEAETPLPSDTGPARTCRKGIKPGAASRLCQCIKRGVVII